MLHYLTLLFHRNVMFFKPTPPPPPPPNTVGYLVLTSASGKVQLPPMASFIYKTKWTNWNWHFWHKINLLPFKYYTTTMLHWLQLELFNCHKNGGSHFFVWFDYSCPDDFALQTTSSRLHFPQYNTSFSFVFNFISLMHNNKGSSNLQHLASKHRRNHKLHKCIIR